jgi:hypothetical protein
MTAANLGLYKMETVYKIQSLEALQPSEQEKLYFDHAGSLLHNEELHNMYSSPNITRQI